MPERVRHQSRIRVAARASIMPTRAGHWERVEWVFGSRVSSSSTYRPE